MKKLNVNFSVVDDLWDHGWNEKYLTVLPKVITDSAIKQSKKHPEKRMIVHYMQPHAPFIGKNRFTEKNGNNLDALIIGDLFKYGNLPVKKLIEAYEDNFVGVFKEVKRLIKNLNGKIVVTADHGEGFGKHRIFFHPIRVRVKELIEVPWLEVKN